MDLIYGKYVWRGKGVEIDSPASATSCTRKSICLEKDGGRMPLDNHWIDAFGWQGWSTESMDVWGILVCCPDTSSLIFMNKQQHLAAPLPWSDVNECVLVTHTVLDWLLDFSQTSKQLLSASLLFLCYFPPFLCFIASKSTQSPIVS